MSIFVYYGIFLYQHLNLHAPHSQLESRECLVTQLEDPSRGRSPMDNAGGLTVRRQIAGPLFTQLIRRKLMW